MQKLVTISFLLLINSFISLAQVPSYIPTNGLVGWWPFNGNANDESGNGYNGANIGATLTNDRFGNNNKSYLFNANSYIVIQNSSNLHLSDSISISCWINSNDITQPQYIVNKSTNGTSNSWLLDISSNPINTYQIRFLNGGGSPQYSSNCLLNSNNWYHIVATYDKNYVKFYVNGQYISSVATSSSTPQNSNLIWIGAAYLPATICHFIGKIDDICIYSRSLKHSEITALYQGCSTPTATITPQTNTNFCQGNNVVLNATTGANYTYEWYNNGTLISGVATNSYAATTAGNYSVKVIDGSCNVTSSATTLTLIDTVTWTGIVDNDWHKPGNWSPEVVPECCNSVKIPFTPNSPVVSGIGKAKNITIYSTSGATLTVNNGAKLQIETCTVNKTENSCPTLPVLTTTAISNATQITIVSGGNITFTGSSSVNARGICWSTSALPTISNSKTTDGSGIGTFTSDLTGLTAGTTYYVRAYATNASGTSYGNEVSFVYSPILSLGDNYGGGIVTYIFQASDNGYISGEQHGIICSASDQSAGIQWFNGSYCCKTSANDEAIGFGLINTNKIINIQGIGSYAASLADNLVLNGYSDWFLPSINELQIVYNNKALIGGFSGEYWSSTEFIYGFNYIKIISFDQGWTASRAKAINSRVRAIRYF